MSSLARASQRAAAGYAGQLSSRSVARTGAPLRPRTFATSFHLVSSWSRSNNTAQTTKPRVRARPAFQPQRRYLETESEFHPVADETLEAIQDAIDELFDPQPEIEYEVSLANGVLNLSLPPHGTWVVNKQTPNRQIWVRLSQCCVVFLYYEQRS